MIRGRSRGTGILDVKKLAIVACELCESPGGPILWRNALARVAAVDEPDYPGFCRVILNRHAAEMTDLPELEQHALMSVVLAVEGVLRAVMRPDKINLASLGNVVPHLHWHVIPGSATTPTSRRPCGRPRSHGGPGARRRHGGAARRAPRASRTVAPGMNGLDIRRSPRTRVRRLPTERLRRLA